MKISDFSMEWEILSSYRKLIENNHFNCLSFVRLSKSQRNVVGRRRKCKIYILHSVKQKEMDAYPTILSATDGNPTIGEKSIGTTVSFVPPRAKLTWQF